MTDDLHYQCLNDQPYPEADVHPRSRATVEILAKKLLTYCEHNAKNQQGDPTHHDLRIGLFGGYGQGKSGVAKAVIKKLENAPEPKPNIWRVDISEHSPDDISNNFDALLAGHSWVRMAFVAFAVLCIGIVIVLFLPNEWLDSRRAWTFSVAIVGFFAWVLFKPLKIKLRRLVFGRWDFLDCIKSKVNPLYDLLPESVKNILSMIPFNLPDVLIVDDLDRVDVEQQKQLLRAIYRYSRDFRFAVLVCMDESALLNSAPTPEDPAELLRKVIHFELRLPQRDQGDFVLMALDACHAAITANPGSLIARYAGTLEFMRALVRVLALMPNASPRRAKRLVNDALGQAAKWLTDVRRKQAEERWQSKTDTDEDINQFEQKIHLYPDDVAGLLRLAGLYELAPECRNDPLALAEVLEDNHVEKLAAFLLRFKAEKESKPDTPRTEREQSILTFFAKTRCIQPFSSWRSLLSTGSVQCTEAMLPSDLGADFFGVKDKQGFWDLLQEARRCFNSIAYAGKPEGLFDLVNDKNKPQPDNRLWLWLLVEAVLATLPVASARFNLLLYLESQCQNSAEGYFKAETARVKPYVYKAWAGDFDITDGLMSSDEVKDFAKRMIGLSDHLGTIALLPIEKLDDVVYSLLANTRQSREVSRVERQIRLTEQSRQQQELAS